MGSTLTNLLYHVVFSTKLRQALILPGFREELHRYIAGIIHGEKGKLLKIGGTADHIHILTKIPPFISLSDMLRDIKANSSKWANEQRKLPSRFYWQSGYGAFTVSESAVENVSTYIDNQEEHHKRMTFQEEFILLLKKHGIEYDERYIWD